MTKALHELIYDNANRIVEIFVHKTRRHDLPPRDAVHNEVVDDLHRFVRQLAMAHQSGQDDHAKAGAKTHGGQRWYAGYDLKSVLLEYGLLRAVIGEVVRDAGYEMTEGEVLRLAQLVDVALAEAAVEFTLRATDEINQALRSAEAAVRARDDVVAVVSHDLRNPLNVIDGSLSMLVEALDDERPDSLRVAVRSNAARIHRASTRMHRLITDLLDLSKIREGRVDIEIREESTARLIEEALEQSAAQAAQRSIRLVNEGAAPGTVLCDLERVMQVFDNIVGNAIKFSSPGGAVWLSVEVAAAHCTFAVRDEGPGIPVEQLPLLFDRFWTAPRSGSGQGTGLGLAIAKGIVEAHGGRIWVASVVGKGTSFFFTLPTNARA